MAAPLISLLFLCLSLFYRHFQQFFCCRQFIRGHWWPLQCVPVKLAKWFVSHLFVGRAVIGADRRKPNPFFLLSYSLGRTLIFFRLDTFSTLIRSNRTDPDGGRLTPVVRQPHRKNNSHSRRVYWRAFFRCLFEFYALYEWRQKAADVQNVGNPCPRLHLLPLKDNFQWCRLIFTKVRTMQHVHVFIRRLLSGRSQGKISLFHRFHSNIWK